MPFLNPIIAGEELIRSSMRSEGYVDAAESGEGSGWQIRRDGSADFYNLTTRGFASGESAAYDTLVVNAMLTYRGEELLSYLSALPRGVIAFGEIGTGVPGASTSDLVAPGTEAPMIELSMVESEDRRFRLSINETVQRGGSGGIRIRYTDDGSAPTLSSPVLTGTAHANGATSSLIHEFSSLEL